MAIATQDHYALLGVIVEDITSADITVIKKCFRKQALVYHPDKGHPSSTILFQVIAAAYEELSDENKKVKYDKWYKSYFRRTHVTESEVNKAINEVIERQEKERRKEAEQREKEELERKEKEELERKEQEAKKKAKQEKKAREQAEQERKVREKAEQERKAKEKVEEERKERERLQRQERQRERERIRKEKEAKEKELKEKKEEEKRAREAAVLEKRRKEEAKRAREALILEKRRKQEEAIAAAKLEEERLKKEQELLNKQEKDRKEFIRKNYNQNKNKIHAKRYRTSSKLGHAEPDLVKSNPTKLSKEKFEALRDELKARADADNEKHRNLEAEIGSITKKSEEFKRLADAALERARVRHAKAMEKCAGQKQASKDLQNQADLLKKSQLETETKLNSLIETYSKAQNETIENHSETNQEKTHSTVKADFSKRTSSSRINEVETNTNDSNESKPLFSIDPKLFKSSLKFSDPPHNNSKPFKFENNSFFQSFNNIQIPDPNENSTFSNENVFSTFSSKNFNFKQNGEVSSSDSPSSSSAPASVSTKEKSTKASTKGSNFNTPPSSSHEPNQKKVDPPVLNFSELNIHDTQT